MVFSSIVFIAVFLPLFLLFYHCAPDVRYKNPVLVVFSLVFYAWGEPIWIIALIFSALIDYSHGLIIERYRGTKIAKFALISSLVLNLGMLFVFKYSGFAVSNINALFGTSFDFGGFKLPLGISFYTFQTLSYTIDVYRNKIKTQHSLVAFMAYVSMFPQLVAGPIVRYSDIDSKLTKRSVTAKSFSEGINRFITGLSKKVLLANSAGEVAGLLLDGPSSPSMMSAWLGIIMFAFQIYYDFSGYSDMAIGLGKMIGFDFPENFNYPYTSASVGEFWRRWHISLSSFFRDYLYIPLGGNRRFYVRNIAVVWFLTGLWHGASWNFILWGLYFGLLILLEKYFLQDLLDRIPRVFSHVYAMLMVLFGWVLFYFTDMDKLGSFISSMFDTSRLSDFTFNSTLGANCFLLAALIIGATELPRKLGQALVKRLGLSAAHVALNAVLLVGCFLMLVGSSFNPFLYFRF